MDAPPLKSSSGCRCAQINVPFTPSRTDASQDQTDVESFAVAEPTRDGFQNYNSNAVAKIPLTYLLSLIKPSFFNWPHRKWRVLVGGLRALDANYNGSRHGILTQKPQTLTNDFFVPPLRDLGTTWKAISEVSDLFEGIKTGNTGKVKWTATRADLIFGSNSELGAIAEVYACEDGKEKWWRSLSPPGLKLRTSMGSSLAWLKQLTNNDKRIHRAAFLLIPGSCSPACPYWLLIGCNRQTCHSYPAPGLWLGEDGPDSNQGS